MRTTSAVLFLLGLSLGLLPTISAFDPSSAPSSTPPLEARVGVEEMLADFAADFRTDPMARPIVFGIEVRDAEPPRWHVYVGDRQEGEADCQVEVVPGFPPEPIAYFTTDLATLTRIHRGELASLTAMGKAFSTDFAPLDLENTPGFKGDERVQETLASLSFHFWTRGSPERIRFRDPSATRSMHGGEGVLFYYQKGFRSGYVYLRPGQHANANELSQTNPFPTLFVLIRGTLQARVGQTECVLTEGEAIFIGPEVHHEFWNDAAAEETAEGVLLMFGEGA